MIINTLSAEKAVGEEFISYMGGTKFTTSAYQGQVYVADCGSTPQRIDIKGNGTTSPSIKFRERVISRTWSQC